MKDKNGVEIDIGDEVEVPEPNSTDMYNNEFVGRVSDFRNDMVTVEDQDGDCWDIEPERLEVI